MHRDAAGVQGDVEPALAFLSGAENDGVGSDELGLAVAGLSHLPDAR